MAEEVVGEPASTAVPSSPGAEANPEPRGPPISADPGSLPPGQGLRPGSPPVPPPPGLDSGMHDDGPRDQSLTVDDGYGNVARSGSKVSVASLMQRKSSLESYREKPVSTRLHMLEFASEKAWWFEGQNALGFTTVLWLVFIYIMYTRAGVLESYDTGLSVSQHMENIVAHPDLSGVRVRAPEKDPLVCRCACQSSSAGMPKGPCDEKASESLTFLGELPAGSSRLPHFSTDALLAASIDPATLGDKLGKGNDDIEAMTWDKIAMPDDVWFWIEHGFLPDVWRARSQSGGNATLQGLVAQKNLIIGGVRIRQKRAQWSATCEDKVGEGLTDFYRTECRSSQPSTSPYGPFAAQVATTANSTQAATPAPTISTPTVNTTLPQAGTEFLPSTTADGDGYYDALFDVELDISHALETAAYDRKHHWVDGATRTITLEAVTLNAEIGMFAIIDIEFEFPSAGGVQKQVQVHTIQAVGSKIEFIDIVPELIWAGLVILLIRQEVVQMLYSCWEKRCLDYWLDLWCVVDWVSIFVSIMIAFFWMWQISSIGSITEDVAALPRGPFASGQPVITQYRTQWQAILDATIAVYLRKQYYQLSLFWYALILTGRFLKGFLAQAKTAMLQLTIGTVSWDFYHLFVFFTMLFLNFQVGGHVLFGAEIDSWSSLPKAGATSVRMLLGTYPFDPMYEMAPFSAICWFWTFLITVVFILMNLIFAMVADYFHVVRRMVGPTDSVWKDIANATKDLWWRMGWRWINLEDREFKAAFLENPYQDVCPGLEEASQVPDSMVRDARHTCLGVRLGRRHIEAMSVEGHTADSHPGFQECTSKGLQEFGPDIMAADHLLELAQTPLMADWENKKESTLLTVRGFVKLLRKHHADMDEHIDGLEAEVTQDHSQLANTVDYLEANVKKCLEEFERLKDSGVHSLAPPMHALPRPGTMAAADAQATSMVKPGALLRAIDNKMGDIQRQKGPQARLPPLKDGDFSAYTNAALMNSSNSSRAFDMVSPRLSKALALGNAPSNEAPVPMLSNQPAALAIGNAAGQPRGDTMGDTMLQLRDAAHADKPDNNAPPAIMNSV